MAIHDLSTDTGYVRLLISDLQDEPIFSDEEIHTVLTHETSPKRAAAQLLLIIAGSELLLAKKLTTQDLVTDGPAVAKELREQAAVLRREAADEAAGSDEAWGFTITGGERSRF